ncbi:Cell wall protein, putative [Penicillium digitatum]|uniref:Cell wall protein, putative n=1 Tax=Penicillium digitatum TaxID=36651 RepID=A0A7T6XVA4_PENDI|nr:Cell wall protein, putative [Penicillium digitatum]
MRSSLVMLAALASAALAYPTEKSVEPRTLGLLGEILGDITVDVYSIVDAILGHHSSGELFAGLSAEGAAALQGGALGCKSGVIHYEAKAALKAWLLFHADIDFSLKNSLLFWCDGYDEFVLSTDVLAALSVYIPGCADIAAKGQLYVTIEGIFEAARLESALVLSAGAQASLSAWIEAQLDLDLGVKIGLNVCAAGGVVGSLSADIKAALLAWINSAKCDLSAHLKISILAWINGHAGGDLVEIGALAETALSTISVGASVGVHVLESGLLSIGGQASLAAFLGVDLAASLAADVKLALEACAKGELATTVELDIRTQLAIWLHGSDCTLGVELKAVVLLWLSFAVEADVSVSLGLVGGLVGDVTGLLTESLSDLSVDLRGALSLCAAGGSLLDLTFAARTELAAFLGGCTSINVDVSIQIIIIEWFTGCSIPGAPSAPASSSVPSLPSSTPYLPSTAAVPSGPGASVSVSVSVPAGTPVASGPVASTTPCDTETSQVVSSTVIPGPHGAGSITVTVPVVPTGTGIPGFPGVPSGPAPSGPAFSGPAPSGPGATTTPCDTETWQIITSTVIPGPHGAGSITVTVPVVPTGTGIPGFPGVPSGPAPSASGPASSGPAPSGPDATTTPCDTETSEIITSTVIPGGPNESGSKTVIIPAVPTATGPAETPSGVAPTGTPVATGPAPSGPAPSGPAASTPCDTETSAIVTSTVIPGGPVPSGPAATTEVPVPSGPAATTEVPVPSGPAPTSAPSKPSGGESVVTKTVTVTATVCGCE